MSLNPFIKWSRYQKTFWKSFKSVEKLQKFLLKQAPPFALQKMFRTKKTSFKNYHATKI